jgi:hypothetical protein
MDGWRWMGLDDDFPIWQALSIGLGFGARPAGLGFLKKNYAL